MPHAGAISMRGGCSDPVLAPFIDSGKSPIETVSAAPGLSHETIAGALLAVVTRTGPSVRMVRGYLRSPRREIVVRYRSTSLLARYASKRRRCPTSLRSPRREWKSCLCARR
jgi:hypothetical protein